MRSQTRLARTTRSTPPRPLIRTGTMGGLSSQTCSLRRSSQSAPRPASSRRRPTPAWCSRLSSRSSGRATPPPLPTRPQAAQPSTIVWPASPRCEPCSPARPSRRCSSRRRRGAARSSTPSSRRACPPAATWRTARCATSRRRARAPLRARSCGSGPSRGSRGRSARRLLRRSRWRSAAATRSVGFRPIDIVKETRLSLGRGDSRVTVVNYRQWGRQPRLPYRHG
mmetsp:Transcript_12432/g.40527  ORF Transcript_12432/g.40527 Transcript_12432/m.40527 type:complete len:225 (+) Transcript_12432:259-933(+)